mmetsp:Transcript_17002/g.26215  ORF Transcript_17002/g.26215 Transcript_17002/m.26215 type:complete len:102 (+) Transcript_17002:1072-1377(+)
MDRLEKKNRDENLPMIPGLKIHELMEAWNREGNEVADWDDTRLQKLSSEFWLSLDDFEKHLRDSERGDHLVLKAIVKKYEARVSRMKQVTSFQLLALETSL